MKVNVVSGKLVKPCKPTPPHLRRYKISLVDESNPVINHVRILYFPSNDQLSCEAKSACLEESLAQILSNFYLLAGRYNKEIREVVCNDQGALLYTSEADVDLSHIINGRVEPEQLNQFLPVDVTAADELTDPNLAVQINRFECGGLAIGVCASHRAMDSAAFVQFLKAWAKAAASGGAILNEPYFDTHSYFPAEHLPPLDYHEPQTQENVVTMRLVFDSKAIHELRQRLRAVEWKSERPPSRVVAVSAFLIQALLRADMSRRGKPRATVLGNLIDIRERTVNPPMPKHTFGTWVAGSLLELTAAEAAVSATGQEFPAMAGKIYQSTVQSIRDCARALSDKRLGRKLLVDNFMEAGKKAESGEWKAIWVTDISKFGEYYLDFGFGKPEWVSLAAVPLQDHVILLNNRSNDGIEAWVCLLESDMQFFRQDEEISMLSATFS